MYMRGQEHGYIWSEALQCADAILLYESIGLSSYSASTEGGFCVVFSKHQLMHEIKMNGKIQATTEEKSQGNW